MITALGCIAVILVAVVIGLVAGSLIVYVQGGYEPAGSCEEYPGASGWNVELWDIGQGTYMQVRFYGALSLGRGQAGRYYGNIFAVGTAETISREHCVLYEQGGVLLIWNLSKVNPTLLNGRYLDQPEVLNVGDRIAMGGYVYLITDISYTA